MSNIIIPGRQGGHRGREIEKDYNTINEADSDSLKEAKLESWVAKALGEELVRLYPNREWGVTVDVRGGMAAIQCLDVSKTMGYRVSLNDTIEVLRQRMKAIGGEILERGRISRGVITPEKVESVPRNFKDEVVGMDNS